MQKVYYKGEPYILIGEKVNIGYLQLEHATKKGNKITVPKNKVQSEEEFSRMIEEKRYQSHVTW